MELWVFWELCLSSMESLLHKTCLTKEKRKLLVTVISALYLCFPGKPNQDKHLVCLHKSQSSRNLSSEKYAQECGSQSALNYNIQLQSSPQPYRSAPFNHLGWISHLSRPSLERTSFNLSDIRSSPICSQDDSVPLSCRLLKPHSSSSKHSTEEENRIQVFVCFPVAVTKCLAWVSCAREGFLGSQLGDTGHGGQEAAEVSFKKPCSSLAV